MCNTNVEALNLNCKSFSSPGTIPERFTDFFSVTSWSEEMICWRVTSSVHSKQPMFVTVKLVSTSSPAMMPPPPPVLPNAIRNAKLPPAVLSVPPHGDAGSATSTPGSTRRRFVETSLNARWRTKPALHIWARGSAGSGGKAVFGKETRFECIVSDTRQRKSGGTNTGLFPRSRGNAEADSNTNLLVVVEQHVE